MRYSKELTIALTEVAYQTVYPDLQIKGDTVWLDGGNNFKDFHQAFETAAANNLNNVILLVSKGSDLSLTFMAVFLDTYGTGFLRVIEMNRKDHTLTVKYQPGSLFSRTGSDQ